MSSIYTILSTDLINDTFDDINTNFSNLNTDKMEKSNNLSDLTNASTARTNLGVNTTANQTDSTDKRFVTDAEKTKLTNLSGTNTGDQTSIVGITGTKAQFDTAVTDGDIVFVGDTISTRLNPRVAQAANYTTSVTMDFDAYDEYDITAQAGALLFNNPSGTPTNCQKRIIRIKDNGTARALTYGTQFASGAATLPTTTTISKKLWIGVEWDSTDSKWYCIASGVAP